MGDERSPCMFIFHDPVYFFVLVLLLHCVFHNTQPLQKTTVSLFIFIFTRTAATGKNTHRHWMHLVSLRGW